MADRTFTPSEANSALEHVRPLAERMAELAGELGAAAAARLDAGVAAGNGHLAAAATTHADPALLDELERCVKELAKLGVEVKDAEAGLVDFPALREGEDVLLCWRVGEPSVAWWHRREDGFSGRRPIDWESG